MSKTLLAGIWEVVLSCPSHLDYLMTRTWDAGGLFRFEVWKQRRICGSKRRWVETNSFPRVVIIPYSLEWQHKTLTTPDNSTKRFRNNQRPSKVSFCVLGQQFNLAVISEIPPPGRREQDQELKKRSRTRTGGLDLNLETAADNLVPPWIAGPVQNYKSK